MPNNKRKKLSDNDRLQHEYDKLSKICPKCSCVLKEYYQSLPKQWKCGHCGFATFNLLEIKRNYVIKPKR